MAREKKIKEKKVKEVKEKKVKAEKVVDANEPVYNFGEKKVDKLKVGRNIILYFLAAVFFIIFVANGVLMQLEVQWEQFPHLAFVYESKIPAIVQIAIMLGSLFTVAVVANFFGGEQEKETHVKEETKIKMK